jgi:hypothetical protein
MGDVLGMVADADARPDGLEPVPVDVDCARLARMLKHSSRRRVGLVPASKGTPVLAFMLELSMALNALTQTLVLMLDPERSLVPQGTPEGAFVYARSMAPGVVALAPFAVAPPGAKVENIRILYQFAGKRDDSFGHVLVDLTGCARPGELAGAIDLVDGIIVIGRAGKTTSGELQKMVRRLPDELSLGVLLTA